MLIRLFSYTHPKKDTTLIEFLRIGKFVMLEIKLDKGSKNSLVIEA
jgi:hypothetical protein